MFALEQLYTKKECPYRRRGEWCIGKNCAKFASCMTDEIDAICDIGFPQECAEEFIKQLFEMVTSCTQ